MPSDQTDKVQEAASLVMELEEELESSGHAATKGEVLEKARAALHRWVDTVVGVVVSPGLGRVTLIHANGRLSSVSSPDLPFAMSAPVADKADE